MQHMCAACVQALENNTFNNGSVDDVCNGRFPSCENAGYPFWVFIVFLVLATIPCYAMCCCATSPVRLILLLRLSCRVPAVISACAAAPPRLCALLCYRACLAMSLLSSRRGKSVRHGLTQLCVDIELRCRRTRSSTSSKAPPWLSPWDTPQHQRSMVILRRRTTTAARSTALRRRLPMAPLLRRRTTPLATRRTVSLRHTATSRRFESVC